MQFNVNHSFSDHCREDAGPHSHILMAVRWLLLMIALLASMKSTHQVSAVQY